jgi:hypothetical protein
MPEIQRDPVEAGEVYELTWEEPAANGLAVPYRLRVVLNPDTKLPKRTMTFQKIPGDEEEWQLAEMRVFEYPSRQSMDLAMKKEVPAGR